MALTFVPTPLGNLRDITLRALDALREAELIVAEDTRVARRLLSAHGIAGTPIWTYHEHNARHVDRGDPRTRGERATSRWSPTPGCRASATPAARWSPRHGRPAIAVERSARTRRRSLAPPSFRVSTSAASPSRASRRGRAGARRAAFRARPRARDPDAFGTSRRTASSPRSPTSRRSRRTRRSSSCASSPNSTSSKSSERAADVAAALPDPVRGEVAFVIDAGVPTRTPPDEAGSLDRAGSTRCSRPASRRAAIAKQLAARGARRTQAPLCARQRASGASGPAQRFRERRPVIPDRAFYVTTPIYYISGTPHIGHAYTTIAADILARTARAWDGARASAHRDRRTRTEGRASRAKPPGRRRKPTSTISRRNGKALGAGLRRAVHDDFIRTTEPRHRVAVSRACSKKCARAATSISATYEGWYCTNDETFWPEAKLVDGRCPNPECRRDVQWLSEKNWFFRLSAYRDRLIAHFTRHPEFLRPASRRTTR